MKNIKTVIFAAVCMAVFGFNGSAFADKRIFPHAYPYMTLPQGAMEFEHYLDIGYLETDNPETLTIVEDDLEPDWKHQIAIEYGITDRLDFGFYNVFKQKPYEPMVYDGLKLRSRYRFGDEGDFFVDPGIYLEVAYSGDEYEIEQKLILSKKIDKLEIALNVVFAEVFEEETSGEWEEGYELKPILGVGYHFSEKFAAGVEYYAFTEIAHGEGGPYVQYAGPSVSVTTSKFWWTLGAQAQLSDYEEEYRYQVRSLLGVNF